MAIFELYWYAAVAIIFIDATQAQRRPENLNFFGRQPNSQNTQTYQANQPSPQFNGQQRWAAPTNNAGANRQSYNDFQRTPFRTSGADLNRPYGEFQQGSQRVPNNAVNRPYNLRSGTIDNGSNRSPDNYAGFQRRPQLQPANGPQRQLIAIDNGPNNGQQQGVGNDYGQIRPYVLNPQRPFLSNDNLRNRPVYYGGPRRVPPSESNKPIYIRRAQMKPTSDSDALNQPIYNVGGPIRVIDSESNKPINLIGYQSEPVVSSDAKPNKQINSEDSNVEQSKESDINAVGKETSSTLSDQPKNSTTSDNSKGSTVEIDKESKPSNASTLSLFYNSDKTLESEIINSTTQDVKQTIKVEATTLSSIKKVSSNASAIEEAGTTEEN